MRIEIAGVLVVRKGAGRVDQGLIAGDLEEQAGVKANRVPEQCPLSVQSCAMIPVFFILCHRYVFVRVKTL
jgi:hypothetical protein